MTEPIRSAGSAHPTTTTAANAQPPPSVWEHTRGAARAGDERGAHGAETAGRSSSGFRDRLKDLGPAGASTSSTSGRAGRHGSIGGALDGAGGEAGATPGHKRAGRAAPGDDGAADAGRERGAGTRTSRAGDAARDLDPTHPAAAELVPFRVGPSILAPPIARAAMDPAAPLDPAQFSAEIVESLRVGRFGRDGHALTMRVRGARSAIDVDLRSENGRLALRMSGDDDAEVARVRARVRADLAARGIEVDDD